MRKEVEHKSPEEVEADNRKALDALNSAKISSSAKKRNYTQSNRELMSQRGKEAYKNFTPEVRQKNSIKGARQGNINARRNKLFMELVRKFLNQECDKAIKQNLQRLGFDAEDMSNMASLIAMAYTRAINNQDLKAAQMLVEWAGMTPMQEMQAEEFRKRMQEREQIVEIDDEPEDVLIYLPDDGRQEVLPLQPFIVDEDN